MSLTEHLRNGQQCDEEGVMCIVSRQACHEAADKIEALETHLRDVLLTVVARVDLHDRLGAHEREVFESARVYVNGEG